MRKKQDQKFLSCILCIVLTVAMALFTTGCNGSTAKKGSPDAQTEEGADKEAADKEAGETQTQADTSGAQTDGDAQSDADGDAQSDADGVQASVYGEGSTQFLFTVVDKDGEETRMEIHTEKKTVGEALEELGIIEGEESEYGLFVKTVNGITADYEKDGMYWAFYINDEYAQSGVDATDITEGDSYAMKLEKA
ncbi:MAG: DUF4430 domain-containing protein [Eubacterium sp.]|nr:DUF4430 domain-containing protein [Eubacterium sp.]